ncbi:MAG TPA: sigma-70 family RNA polymerase sigma factor [Usitatibacter sp.]|jgi:RNA polymerase sigma-70 factor (ECF subfamily)|nr:sigma-70 family RNA polymerase sigma factor [Usitatibacter sp.]
MTELSMTDPRFAEIEGHRPYLVRYAMAQLRDPQLAEEAVQDCLLAALEGISRFAGESTLRTWLTAILRFKVIDLQRRTIAERRNVELTESIAYGEDEAWMDDLFDETGHWRDPPQAWSNPESAFEQKRFWEVFDRCIERLPAAAGRVFFKREVLGEDTEEICRAEGITASNCWVILHRARIALRGCLEANWFGDDVPAA